MDAQVASEWVLIISGLIAHADGILEHEECERLLSMLDEEEVDAETYSAWVSNIGDLEFLEERFVALPRPEGDAVFVALREAWLMAMADGERSESEDRALVDVAARFDVDEAALARHREAWGAFELKFSEVVAELSVALVGDGQPLSDSARRVFSDLAEHLPTEGDHKNELVAMAVVPVTMAAAVQKIAGLERRAAIRCLRFVSQVVGAHEDPASARGRFEQLVRATDLSERLREHLMDLSHN
jgi:uncharacterized tellurite resistance protein B-like protein